MVRSGFERLIDTTLDDKWWSLAKLPSKFGGLGLRTGLGTHGAKYVMSLAHCADDISRLVEGWSEVVVARRDAKQWLSHKLGID